MSYVVYCCQLIIPRWYHAIPSVNTSCLAVVARTLERWKNLGSVPSTIGPTRLGQAQIGKIMENPWKAWMSWNMTSQLKIKNVFKTIFGLHLCFVRVVTAQRFMTNGFVLVVPCTVLETDVSHQRFSCQGSSRLLPQMLSPPSLHGWFCSTYSFFLSFFLSFFHTLPVSINKNSWIHLPLGSNGIWMFLLQKKITLLRVIPTMTCWVEVVRWGLSLRIWWEEWRIWEHWFQVSLA